MIGIGKSEYTSECYHLSFRRNGSGVLIFLPYLVTLESYESLSDLVDLSLDSDDLVDDCWLEGGESITSLCSIIGVRMDEEFYDETNWSSMSMMLLIFSECKLTCVDVVRVVLDHNEFIRILAFLCQNDLN